MPPASRSTAARNAAWLTPTRASARGARTRRRGPRQRSCWPLTWARAPMTHARPRRVCCAGRWLGCRSGHAPGGGWRCAPTPGTSPARWPGPAKTSNIGFAIGARRIAPLWRLLDGIREDSWRDAIDMDNAQVTVAAYCPDWWPATTRLLIRRVRLDPGQVSADPRSRRRRTRHPGQRSLPVAELEDAGAVYAYSFILTNLDVSAPGKAAAAEHWYRHRTTIEMSKPQCCHTCGLSAFSLAPSSALLILAS